MKDEVIRTGLYGPGTPSDEGKGYRIIKNCPLPPFVLEKLFPNGMIGLGEILEEDKELLNVYRTEIIIMLENLQEKIIEYEKDNPGQELLINMVSLRMNPVMPTKYGRRSFYLGSGGIHEEWWGPKEYSSSPHKKLFHDNVEEFIDYYYRIGEDLDELVNTVRKSVHEHTLNGQRIVNNDFFSKFYEG